MKENMFVHVVYYLYVGNVGFGVRMYEVIARAYIRYLAVIAILLIKTTLA